MNTPHRQSEITLGGFLAIFTVAIFIGMFVFKVGPAYIENLTINKIAEDTAGNTELMRGPKSKLMSSLESAYNTNNLWGMKPEETIALTRNKESGFIMTVKYEKRTNLISNIDVVTVFEKEITPSL